MSRKSYIRGVGLVGAQGTTAPATWHALLQGAALTGHHGAPLACDKYDRVTQLALTASREAIAEAGWGVRELANDQTALVIGSSKGPIERWVAEIADQAPRPLIGVGEVASDVAAALSMFGPRHTLAAACASGLHALIHADQLLKTNRCDRALVVGCESSLHPLFIATFTRLGVLSKRLRCAPFDASRDGFLMSEAAAAVCLDREGEVEIESGLMLSDAHHLTGIDPAGAALRYMLQQIGGEVDLVHAHGTATEQNDPVELAAIDDVLGASKPAIYSHKAALGHTQGASGMIGVVLNVLAHRHNIVPPNVNTPEPIASRSTVSDRVVERRIDRSVVLAAGFGGAMGAVALRKRA